jgi:hypothetical protein
MSRRPPLKPSVTEHGRLVVTTAASVTLTARRVVHGQYGEVVEFYEGPSVDGPAICSYTTSTFLEVDGGLALHMGVPAWALDRATVIEVQDWLRETESRGGVVLPFRRP